MANIVVSQTPKQTRTPLVAIHTQLNLTFPTMSFSITFCKLIIGPLLLALYPQYCLYSAFLFFSLSLIICFFDNVDISTFFTSLLPSIGLSIVISMSILFLLKYILKCALFLVTVGLLHLESISATIDWTKLLIIGILGLGMLGSANLNLRVHTFISSFFSHSLY